MDIEFSDAEQAFRDEVRSFLKDQLPPEISDRIEGGIEMRREDFTRWHKILYQHGWVAPGWPKEYGGTGWTPIQRYIFDEECAAAAAPRVMPFGVSMVGPVIYTFGNDAQKAHYLPRILSNQDWWCQGYSEPGSGSDLASLRTRAIRDGDHYVVNGQKTWTTTAHWADWIFCLVRTSTEGKQQEGISFLLIDMKTPGIEVRPIITMDGGHEVNDVFLEDVRVPVENLIGEENKGWTYAKFLLSHERAGIADVGSSKKQIARLKAIANAEQSNGRPLAEDKRFRDKISELEIDLMAVEFTELRALSRESAGKPPGPEANLLKIRGTEVQQRITELALEAVGYYANPYVPDALKDGWNEDPIGPEYAAAIAPRYFNWRKASIYGGSNEIQKSIIAKMVLGL
jgi:alkylation response protein AidB-like acyl-CoA dehydrogenase